MSEQTATPPPEVAPLARSPAQRKAIDRSAAKAMRARASFTRDEAAFLPAALEILERPPNPLARLVLLLIVAALGAAIVWAANSQLDVVAVAEGRVVPRARLQSVEAAEAGIVRAIKVREGQIVKAGEPLIELDATFAGADRASARSEYAAAGLAKARADALLAFAAGKPTKLIRPEGADAAAVAGEEAAVRARIAALRERLSGVSARMEGAEADLLRLEQTLPLINQQLEGRRTLFAKGLAARDGVLQLEERAITTRQEAQSRRAEIAALRNERAQALAEFTGQAAAEKAEAESILATRAGEVKKALGREAFTTLAAPVDGIVNEVAVSTLGDVVEAGAPLVTIVPAGEELIVEALVLNKDVAQIAPGLHAAIKLEAYPFTRHGFLEGVVESVSPDAVADERRGLVFPARVRVTKTALRDVGLRALSPGMTAQVEIQTGTRSVLSYLLSPIAKATSEAGRER
ncbi:MAG: HlyD family type I secretion periplasmic adaptor subunit [Caulobacterales bacterium]